MIITSWKAKIIVGIADVINSSANIVGVTWKPNIYIYPEKYKKNIKLIKHEECHLKQQREMGKFKFIVVYVHQYFKYGYWDMPLEIEARKAELENN